MVRLKWSRLLRKRPLVNEQHAEPSKSQASNVASRLLASAVCQTSNPLFVIGYLIAFSYSAFHAPLTLPGVIFVASIASLLSELCRYEFFTCRRNTSVCSYICTYQNLGELPAYLTGWLQLLGRSSSVSLVSRALGSVLAQIIGNRLVSHHLTSQWLVAEDTIGITAQVVVGLFLVFGLKMIKRFSVAIKAATLTGVLVFVTAVSSREAQEHEPATASTLHNISTSHQRPPAYYSQPEPKEEFLLSAALIGMSFKHENKEALLLSKSSLISAYVGVNYCATLLVLVVMSITAYFIPFEEPQQLSGCPLLETLIAATKDSHWCVPMFASLAILATSTTLVEAIDDARRLLVKLASDGLVFKKLAAHREWALWLQVALSVFLETTLSTFALVCTITFVHLAPDVGIGVVVTYRRYCCATPAPAASRGKRWRCEAPREESDSDTDIDAAVDEYKTHVYVSTVMDWNASEEKPFNPADGLKIRALLFVIAIAILTTSLSLRWISDMSAVPISISLLSLIVYFTALSIVWSKSQKPRAKIATFRVPCVPWISIGASLSASVLLFQLPGFTWLIISVWITIGLALYASYGYKNSRLKFKIPKSRPRESGNVLERNSNLRILPRMIPDISFSSIAVYPQPYSAM